MQAFGANRSFHGIGDRIAETLWELGTDGKHSGVNARGTATDQATVKDAVFVPVDLQRALAIRSTVGNTLSPRKSSHPREN